MKPPKFSYLAPESVKNAIAMKQELGENARYIAGGQSLVPMMNFRVAAPSALIDLNGLTELSKVSLSSDSALNIGALTRTRRLENDPKITGAHPLLAAAARHIAHAQIRNRGTIGGSIAHADPAAELPGIVLACDAEIELQGPRGFRTVHAVDFFESVFTTALEEGELLLNIKFPRWPKDRKWGFQEVSRREGDYALVGIAAWFDLDATSSISACGLSAIGAADTPVRLTKSEAALLGSVPSLPLFEKAAAEVTADIDPFDDVHASAIYRCEVAAALAIRTLTEAWERET